VRTMLLLTVTFLVFAAYVHAGEDPEYSVEVGFLTMNGHQRKIEVKVTEKQAKRLQFFPREVSEVIDEAKRLYAEKLGFSRKTYGPDVWKIVPGLRFEYADLNMADGTTVELR
jgi:hypothetical protein